MAKQAPAKNAPGEPSGFGAILGMVRDGVVSSVKARIREDFEQGMEVLELRLLDIQKRLIHSLGTAVFAATSLVLLLVAGTFALIDTFGISRASALLILSVAFAIVAFVLYFINRE